MYNILPSALEHLLPMVGTVVETSLGLEQVKCGPKDKINLFLFGIVKGTGLCFVRMKFPKLVFRMNGLLRRKPRLLSF